MLPSPGKSDTVTLTTAVTANIYTCDTALTNDGAVSVTTGGSKEGTQSVGVTLTSAFTGLACHKDLGSSTDLSAYQQISLWIFPQSFAMAANTLRIDLCSDTAGTTILHSFTVNKKLASSTFNVVTLDNGSALANNVRSIAFYMLLGQGSGSNKTLFFDNILACKAPSAGDSLTLNSVIGLNDGIWYAIRSINGTTIKLDSTCLDNTTVTARGFGGQSTVTQTIYKRDPIQFSDATVNGITIPGSTSGTSGSPITISGGWDDTNMSTQTGETFIDQLGSINSSTLYGLTSTNTLNWITVEKLGFVRPCVAININGANWNINNCWCVMNDKSNFALKYAVSASSGPVNLSNWTQVQGGQFATTSNVGNPIYCTNTMNIISPQGTAIAFGATGLWFSHSGTINIGNAVSPALSINGAMNINILNIYDYATSGLALNTAVGKVRINKLTCSNNNNSGTTGLIIANTGSNVVETRIDELATLGNATGISYTAPSTGGLTGKAIIKRWRSTDTTDISATFGSSSSLYDDFRIQTHSEGAATASNSPSSGSSVTINLSNTLGIGTAQKVLVTDGTNTEEATTTAVSTNTSITVATLAYSYTTPLVYNLQKHITRTEGGTIQTDAGSDRRTASGVCWKFSPTASRRDSYYPLSMSIAQVPVSAGTAVTVSAYMKYSGSGAVTGQLRVPSNSMVGVGTVDLVSTTVSSTSYAQKTITFTPLETGVVEVWVDAWSVSGTSDSVWVDDFDCTQV